MAENFSINFISLNLNFQMEEVSVDKFRNERWRDLRRLTDGKSVFAHPAFEPGMQVITSNFRHIFFHHCRHIPVIK